MAIGRFTAGIAALIWSPEEDRYLLLKRSEEKDFAAGVWECVTGRVDQGESFEEAVHREVREELGVGVHIECLLGTTHFYRGEARPENELLGVVYGCSLREGSVRIGKEHSEFRWVTAGEARELLTAPDASTRWTRTVVERADTVLGRMPGELRTYYREEGFEL
jgi:8-oxo-dGTP diphosphatase